MINPYEKVDWGTWQKVISVSHGHAKTQEHFNNLYAGGVRHFAVSNYYRSEPLYPAVNGVISGIETVEDITVPNDTILSPNAEHHNMPVNSLHMCSIGSFFSSGSPEVDNGDGTYDRTALPKGMDGRSWKTLVKKALRDRQYRGLCGLTINHPTWSHLSLANIFKILDYSDTVIGIEAYNTDLENDLKYWDNVLKTGRQAWGFFVPDHKHKTKPNGDWEGRNVLLVPQADDKSCLSAYMHGQFFGRLKNTDLSFTGISVNGRVITVSTNAAEKITVIEGDTRAEYSDASCVHTCSADSVYARIEADGLGDTIYSQPVIFKVFKPKSTLETMRKKRQRMMAW